MVGHDDLNACECKWRSVQGSRTHRQVRRKATRDILGYTRQTFATGLSALSIFAVIAYAAREVEIFRPGGRQHKRLRSSHARSVGLIGTPTPFVPISQHRSASVIACLPRRARGMLPHIVLHGEREQHWLPDAHHERLQSVWAVHALG